MMMMGWTEEKERTDRWGDRGNVHGYREREEEKKTQDGKRKEERKREKKNVLNKQPHAR